MFSSIWPMGESREAGPTPDGGAHSGMGGMGQGCPKPTPNRSIEKSTLRRYAPLGEKMALNSEQKKLLNEAHSQNEEGRDAFLAIAHTALFAASLGFIGNLIDKDPPKLIWLLIVGWSSSVIGLSALTWSFYEAKRQILRASKEEQTNPNAVRLANNAALWSFPVALLMIFLFAIINLVNIDEKEERYASPGRPGSTYRRFRIPAQHRLPVRHRLRHRSQRRALRNGNLATKYG